MLPHKEKLQAYLKAKQEKALLDSRSRILGSTIDKLRDEFLGAIETYGSKSGELKTGGHRLWTGPGQRRPNWKEHFIEAKGEDAAEAVMNATEPSTVLFVEPLP